MPPFLTRRGACATEKECCLQASQAFEHIWFHAYLQTSNPDEAEKLILWKDLLETNNAMRDDLISLIHVLFNAVAGTDHKLATFLKLCLKRALQ